MSHFSSKPSQLFSVALATMSTFVILPKEAYAETRSMVTGDSPEKVQQNAFEKGMDYPVGPLKCSQRCSQWWGKD